MLQQHAHCAFTHKKRSHWCTVWANLILWEQVGLQVFLKSFLRIVLSQGNGQTVPRLGCSSGKCSDSKSPFPRSAACHGWSAWPVLTNSPLTIQYTLIRPWSWTRWSTFRPEATGITICIKNTPVYGTVRVYSVCCGACRWLITRSRARFPYLSMISHATGSRPGN